MSKKKWASVAVLAVAVIVGWFKYFQFLIGLLMQQEETTSFAVLGQIGDAFNILNCMFSALTIVGLIAAIMLQHEELKTARDGQKLQTELEFLSRYLEALSVARQTKPTKGATLDDKTEHARIDRITKIFESRANSILCKELLSALHSPSRVDYLKRITEELSLLWERHGNNLTEKRQMLGDLIGRHRDEIYMLLGTADAAVQPVGDYALVMLDTLISECKAKVIHSQEENQIKKLVPLWKNTEAAVNKLTNAFRMLEKIDAHLPIQTNRFIHPVTD